jgi:hypothetical protein
MNSSIPKTTTNTSRSRALPTVQFDATEYECLLAQRATDGFDAADNALSIPEPGSWWRLAVWQSLPSCLVSWPLYTETELYLTFPQRAGLHV